MAEPGGTAPSRPDAATDEGPDSPSAGAADHGEASELALSIELDNASQPGRTIARIGGEVDMLTAPRLRDTLSPVINEPGADVVLDLDGVTFLGSNGLGALVELSQQAQAAGTALRLVCATKIVTRPLALTGLDQVLDSYETLAELPPAGG